MKNKIQNREQLNKRIVKSEVILRRSEFKCSVRTISLKSPLGFCRVQLFFLLLFVFPLLLGAGVGFAQNTKLDSLKTLLKTDKEDTNKVIHLNKLIRECAFAGDFDDGLKYGKESIQLALKLNFKKGAAQASSGIGNIYLAQGDYPKSLDYYLRALKIDEELENKSGIARHLGNIGNVYQNQSNNPKALDYYFKALKMAKELGNKQVQANNLGNIGIVYWSQGNYAKAGSAERNQSLSKALEYYLSALKMAEELGDKNGIARHFGNIGIVYYEQASEASSTFQQGVLRTSASDSLYKMALHYYFKALNTNEELGRKNGIAIQLGNIGALYTEQKKYKEGYDYLYRALAIADSIGAMFEVKDHFEMLSKLYENANIPLHDSAGGKLLNMEQMRLRALYYHKRYIAIRDTLFSEENKKQLVRKEMNFEFEKKESAAKAEQEKQTAVAAAESRRQRIVLALVSCFLLLVVVLAGFIFRSLRITRKQKHIIEIQKELVEEKQKEILDSIYYARRIQRSLLTSEKYIDKSLKRLGKN